jgi:hypothetical protein
MYCFGFFITPCNLGSVVCPRIGQMTNQVSSSPAYAPAVSFQMQHLSKILNVLATRFQTCLAFIDCVDDSSQEQPHTRLVSIAV